MCCLSPIIVRLAYWVMHALSGNTLLYSVHLTAWHGQLAVVRLLLELGQGRLSSSCASVRACTARACPCSCLLPIRRKRQPIATVPITVRTPSSPSSSDSESTSLAPRPIPLPITSKFPFSPRLEPCYQRHAARPLPTNAKSAHRLDICQPTSRTICATPRKSGPCSGPYSYIASFDPFRTFLYISFVLDLPLLCQLYLLTIHRLPSP